VTHAELNILFDDAWPGPHKESDFRPILERSLGYVCARKDGQLVGFVNVAWDGGVHAFLLDPIVRTDCQRRGIGRELVCRAEGLAREAGAEWLHVDLTRRLKEFYRQCGFRESRAGLINLKETEQSRTGCID
jgi:N-acetylglutamate synthase-like GNAT family acetyltransferase